MTTLSPFHLAITVRDIAEARWFYGELMGCPEGRSTDSWVDFDLFGHQFVVHLDPDMGPDGHAQQIRNPVDRRQVPVPHFGVVLSMPDWQALVDRLQAAGVQFIIEPTIRFPGEPGEQATMFILDPSGNALEFKGFANMEKLFAIS